MKMTIDTLFQNFNTMWTSFKAYCKKEKKTGSMLRLLHPFLFFSNLHSFESFNKGLSYFTHSNYSYTFTCHDHKISLLIDPDIVVRQIFYIAQRTNNCVISALKITKALKIHGDFQKYISRIAAYKTSDFFTREYKVLNSE